MSLGPHTPVPCVSSSVLCLLNWHGVFTVRKNEELKVSCACVLELLQTSRGEVVGISKAFGSSAGKQLLKILKLFFYFGRVSMDLRLPTKLLDQTQYNFFNLLGILFLKHSNIMIQTFQFSVCLYLIANVKVIFLGYHRLRYHSNPWKKCSNIRSLFYSDSVFPQKINKTWLIY